MSAFGHARILKLKFLLLLGLKVQTRSQLVFHIKRSLRPASHSPFLENTSHGWLTHGGIIVQISLFKTVWVSVDRFFGTLEAVALIFLINRVPVFFWLSGASGVSAQFFAESKGLFTKRGSLMGQSSLEVFYLCKKLFDEFLAIAFQCDRDDVLEVIYLVMRKLTLRKRSNSLF